MPTQYNFKTEWVFDAPIEKVWDLIINSTQWPTWWKGVLEVNEIDSGKEHGINSVVEFTWQSVLPYKLQFSMKLTDNIEHKKLSGIAFGELEGNGTWIFDEKDGKVFVTYYWNVITNKIWMNWFAFILKPLFQFNHNIIMSWGEQGLRKQLTKLQISSTF